MNIAIVGSSGFVGHYLIEELQSDHTLFLGDIKNINQPNLNIFYLDITDEQKINLPENIDIIINLAAVHRDDIRDISLYDRVNVEGSRNLCQFASDHGIHKMIFLSSVAVYGDQNQDSPNDETSKTNYSNHYGRTKLAAEAVYRKWVNSNEKNSLIIIRPTVVFGVGNRGNVYNLINTMHRGYFFMIGKGLNKKSICYVKNVTAFIRHCLTDSSKEVIYNYVDSPTLTMEEFVNYIRSELGLSNKPNIRIPYFLGLSIGYMFDLFSAIFRKNFSISSIRVKKFCNNSLFLSNNIDESFSPPFNIHEGLKEVVKKDFLAAEKDHKIFFTE